MDDAELIGGVVLDTPDPLAAARELARLVGCGQFDYDAARQAGFDPALVAVIQTALAGDQDRTRMACELGAAWAMGRRSAPRLGTWELVVSLPSAIPLPPGVRHATAETLTQLVVEARRSVLLVSPFMDTIGVSLLADAIAASTVRGVCVDLVLPTRSTHAEAALAELDALVVQSGVKHNLRKSSLNLEAPWAHLKVLVADSEVAYIGSANLTGPGIGGHNLELGVLVRGPQVALIEDIVGRFRDDPATAPE